MSDIALSRLVATVTGTSDRTHPFGFEFQNKEHVKVYLNGSALTQDDGSSASNFSISGTSGSANVVLGGSVSIAASDLLVIQRETPRTYTDSPVQWTTGPLKASDLEASAKHQLYLAQEALRDAQDLSDVLFFQSPLSGSANVDNTGATTGVFDSGSSLTLDPDDSDAITVYGQSPTGYTLAGNAVTFQQVGKYLVDIDVSLSTLSSGVGTRIGFGDQFQPAQEFLRNDGLGRQLNGKFILNITAPATHKAYCAVSSGSVTLKGVTLTIRRIE